jgi:dipeptidase E
VTARRPGQIVAMGGGGFSMEPDNPLPDEFVLSLARRRSPRVCFIPTASADSAMYIARFYRAFGGRCHPTDLTFNDPQSLPRNPRTSADLPAFVAAQDIFYVGGGNTANLLAVWRTHGLDVLLRRAWKRGAILSGISAGMICWFEGGLTDSFGGLQPMHDGLGLLRGTACPHDEGEAGRRAAYHELIAQGGRPGYAADDGAAFHFVGNRLERVVSSRLGAGAYTVQLKRGRVVETPIEARFLGRARRRR